MSAPMIALTFKDPAMPKDVVCSVPATLTVAGLQAIMRARPAMTLPDGSSPSGAAVLGDLAAAFSDSPALTLRVAREVTMGAGCLCCGGGGGPSQQDQLDDYYTHILQQELNR